MNTRGRKFTVLAAGIALSGGLLGAPGLASAAPIPEDGYDTKAYRYIEGSGDMQNDLNDETNLTVGSRSDWVGMWQMILVADGLLKSSEVDCTFGPKTQNATKIWQFARFIPNTGVVGSKTRTRASKSLDKVPGTKGVVYVGQSDYARFSRENGKYYKGGQGYVYDNAVHWPTCK